RSGAGPSPLARLPARERRPDGRRVEAHCRRPIRGGAAVSGLIARVIDDFGLGRLGAGNRRDRFGIIEDRHGARSTVVTTGSGVAVPAPPSGSTGCAFPV
ncbi:MAG: hypothetical protein OXI15_21055, partial [Chromatiales bacterium]|nr:hypothetical protein [Chromatiales bacterium]